MFGLDYADLFLEKGSGFIEEEITRFGDRVGICHSAEDFNTSAFYLVIRDDSRQLFGDVVGSVGLHRDFTCHTQSDESGGIVELIESVWSDDLRYASLESLAQCTHSSVMDYGGASWEKLRERNAAEVSEAVRQIGQLFRESGKHKPTKSCGSAPFDRFDKESGLGRCCGSRDKDDWRVARVKEVDDVRLERLLCLIVEREVCGPDACGPAGLRFCEPFKEQA